MRDYKMSEIKRLCRKYRESSKKINQPNTETTDFSQLFDKISADLIFPVLKEYESVLEAGGYTCDIDTEDLSYTLLKKELQINFWVVDSRQDKPDKKSNLIARLSIRAACDAQRIEFYTAFPFGRGHTGLMDDLPMEGFKALALKRIIHTFLRQFFNPEKNVETFEPACRTTFKQSTNGRSGWSQAAELYQDNDYIQA